MGVTRPATQPKSERVHPNSALQGPFYLGANNNHRGPDEHVPNPQQCSLQREFHQDVGACVVVRDGESVVRDTPESGCFVEVNCRLQA